MNGSLAAVCVALTLLTAGTVSADDRPANECCMPDQWEGIEDITYQQVNPITVYTAWIQSNVSYDATNMREAYTTFTTDSQGNQLRSKVLNDYKNHIRLVVNLNTQRCTRYILLDYFPKRCLPTTSTVRDSNLTYGGANDTLEVSRVDYTQRQGVDTQYASVTLTDGCIPVVEQIYTPKTGGRTFRFEEFENIKIGIESESVFDVPDQCVNSVTKRSEPSHPLEDLLFKIQSRK